MTSSSILLKNGTVLQHDAQDNVCVRRQTDILITDDRIAEIGQYLHGQNVECIIDCTDKIISPGLIDSHHHMWQTQLKGRHGNHTLLDYMTAANLQAINFTPQDLFWGQLGGCLEALDAGTTCVIDNAHMSASAEHGDVALGATIASGIRSIFCYGVTPARATEWTSTTFKLDRSSAFPPWFFDQLEEMAKKAPFGSDGRKVRRMGVKMITSHFRHWSVSAGQSKIPEILHAASLLSPDILLSHGNGVTSSQAELLTSAGVYIASTPDAEIFMASGADPIAFRADLPLTSLGADCHSCGPASMLHQAQLAMGNDRANQMSESHDKGGYPKEFRAKVQDAFNMVTINGARAARMEDRIGSIAVGKLADLVIFDADTPSMICAAEHDPLVAVVRHAGPREINTVIVGGRIVKRNGLLCQVDLVKGLEESGESFALGLDETSTLSWKQVAQNLLASRAELQKRIEKVNIDLARGELFSVFGISEDELFL
ncbi:hypothetical protein BGW36DRAFT_307021 [Talaromyces proteolyticus]|uniref:Amidohydrolase-related domain-containing protein n=1 Tax=Talaromyces proteolyticus TaxID=1131652 RepID=A0AAD4KET6_9EURO|nr:uncharacterized protein BGW36DRAFT_307021 [Talaromyces proteolyticus]KAH8690240.1 hypothetical protein BGW36DRAFT_307021 [Talaromyces proteolyticus]